MRSLTIITLLSLTLYALADEEEQGHVLELTVENFDDTLKDAPWCGHCKSFAPEYEKAALMLHDASSKVKLAKLDATVHTAIAQRYKVQGYPTIKFIKNGIDMDYNGPRDAQGVVDWLTKRMEAPVKTINSIEELETLKKQNRMLGIIFSKDPKSSFHEMITTYAMETDHVVIGAISDDSVAKSANIGPNEFILYKQFDDPVVKYEGDMNQEGIAKFVKFEKVPLVTEFTQETAQIVFDSDIKIHMIAFSGKKSVDYQEHLKLLKDVAVALKGKCHIVLIDMDESEYVRVGEFFGIEAKDVPTFRVIKMEDDMLRFQPTSQAFTFDNIKQFGLDVILGKAKPHRKSAEEPGDWDSAPVKVLVANTFPMRAITKDKAVFVEFYAPWCGHCKAIAPIWEKLGAHFEKDNEVMIAKLDATENELEEISIKSFPTLKFSPKGSTEWVDYKGARTEEAFIKYVESNGKEEEKESLDKDSDGHDEL